MRRVRPSVRPPLPSPPALCRPEYRAPNADPGQGQGRRYARVPSTHPPTLPSHLSPVDMVLHPKGRRTNEETFEERLSAAEEWRAWFRGADVEVQRKVLSAPTQQVHGRVCGLWTKFVSTLEDSEIGALGPGVVLGMATPSAAVLKGFVRFLALTLQCHLSEFPTVGSVSSYVWTLYSVLQREGGLSTEHREKRFASQADVRKLVDAYHTDAQHFRSNRMCLQMSALTMLFSISAERIGALVESNCYRGSNECLKWKDVEVVVFSDRDAPSKPIVGMQVTARLLKGGRDVGSFFKTFFLFPERGANRPYCPIAPLLALGLLDQVWEGIGGPEDIATPSADLTSGVYALRVNESKRDLPVFKREEKTSSGGWSVSEDRVMNYGAACRHLRYFSRISGFPVDVRPYDIRRGVAVTRELRFLLQRSRARYFAEASPRQLGGETSRPPTTPTLSSTSAIGSSQLSRYRKPCVSAILAQAGAEIPPDSSISTTSSTHVDRLVSLLYGEIPEADHHEVFLKTVHLLLDLPGSEQVLCYPGESLADQDRCPVCGSPRNVMKRGAAHHIHRCLVNRKEEEADAVLDGGCVLLQCCWAECTESDQPWMSRTELTEHMDKHVRNVQSCRWVDANGDLCGEKSVAGSMHRGVLLLCLLDVVRVPSVRPTFLLVTTSSSTTTTSSRFPDTAGDGLNWEVHCHEHYGDLFAQFSQREDEAVDVEPVGIQLHPDTDKRISYEDGVTFAPMFCVWCVHDDRLSMVERMTQWVLLSISESDPTPFITSRYHDETVFYGHLTVGPSRTPNTIYFFTLLPYTVWEFVDVRGAGRGVV
ncbi:hypothetical protein JVT61DRAFT_15613 [Boletus reticuloceps]|uniref:Uncharacterized protein n=1 Tax=Boletus reticuloceps TaxID=495285 RepID=A0A8I2YC69_9AGAM|nr:hypothetical protein JVT61DRAFT_15613 [Boletus reticuloceps]